MVLNSRRIAMVKYSLIVKDYRTRPDGWRIFTQFQRILNGLILAIVCVCPSVRPSFTKCTIMYPEQTAGPSGANLCTRMHIDKRRSSANFHSNRQRLLFSKVNDFNRIHWEFQTWCISKMMTDRTNIAIVNTGIRMWPSHWHIYIWFLSSSRSDTFRL